MTTHPARLRMLALGLLGLAFVFGCSTERGGGGAQRVVGVSSRSLLAGNGLTLSATPDTIVIKPSDPSTLIDPSHGNERYGRSTLLVLATGPDGKAQPDLKVTFTTSAGALASGGDTLTTDALGHASDTLRVYESDPGSVEVSVSDGDRTTKIQVTKIVAEPPVANAGPDQVVECTGNSSAQVRLDGSASTDPNNDITLYEWFEHFGASDQVLLDKGKTADVVLPLGDHVITLRVTDATGLNSTDSVDVKVVDTMPPVVELSTTPSRLWPPNHKMVHVQANLTVHECGPYTVSLESITSSESDNGLGDGDTSNDIQGAELGTADYDFDLRAERSGGGSGRIYTVTYRVTDAGGLSTLATTHVVVPHDQGKK
jgi:hypothetical protein